MCSNKLNLYRFGNQVADNKFASRSEVFSETWQDSEQHIGPETMPNKLSGVNNTSRGFVFSRTILLCPPRKLILRVNSG